MTALITTNDIEDEVLAPLIVASDLAQATSKIVQIAASLGVSESEIATPLKDDVLALAIAVACERRAKFAIGTATSSVDGNDVYAIKQRIYAKEMANLEYKITVNALTQSITSPSDLTATIELYRT